MTLSVGIAFVAVSIIAFLYDRRLAELAAANHIDGLAGDLLRETLAAGVVILVGVMIVSYLASRRFASYVVDVSTRSRAVIDSALDVIISMNEDGRILSVNPAVGRILQYSPGELVGRSIDTLMGDGMPGAHEVYLGEYRKTGVRKVIGHVQEVPVRRRDGTLFPAELSVSEAFINGHRIFTGNIRDISDRKAAEAEREQLIEALARTNRELDEFAFVIAHDLKAPIHHIGYLVQFIERDLEEGNGEQLRANRDRLLATARRMEDLINALQHYAISDTPIELAEMGLDQALEGSLSNLAEEIAARDAQISQGRLPMVLGNLPLLTQLLQNLVGNGLKYCGSARPEVHISAETVGDDVTVSVADNGIGVPPAHQQAIFQPFRRLHRQSDIAGTGLGLAICRKIVERHGGKIWCESGPSGGSIFRFTLSAA